MKKILVVIVIVLVIMVNMTPVVAGTMGSSCPEGDGGEMLPAQWLINRVVLDREFILHDDGLIYRHLYVRDTMGVGYQCNVHSYHKDLEYTYEWEHVIIEFFSYPGQAGITE